MTRTKLQKPSNLLFPIRVKQVSGKILLLYRSKQRGMGKLSVASSDDGFTFKSLSTSIGLLKSNGSHIESDNIVAPIMSSVLHEEYLVYSQEARLHFATNIKAEGISIWQKQSAKLPSAKYGMFLDEYHHLGQKLLIYGSNSINIALTKDMQSFHSPPMPIISPRPKNFDSANIELINATIIDQGILMIYQSAQTRKSNRQLTIGAALLDKKKPGTVLWRSEEALLKLDSKRSKAERCIGAIINNSFIILYFTDKNGGLHGTVIHQPFATNILSVSERLSLERHVNNPIIAPEGGNEWENVGTFNPAVLQDDDGKIHLLYRALDHRGVSYVGYASTLDGVTIDYRHPTPAYWPRAEFEGASNPDYKKWDSEYGSGGGWGGCEDPKITRINDKIYLTYVAHNGYGDPRLAMSSISIEDFKSMNWHKWEFPRLISEPGVVNKSGVILPEKIGGKYVIFHRVYPNILIHYTDDIEKLGISEYVQAHGQIPRREKSWDSRKLSIGSTPIRIKDGWLVIYHAVDDKDSAKYKIGAMILDANDPSQVLYRTSSPILEPRESYENEWKFGIAYPSGATIKDGTLFVYYGGGDRHVCVATANLEQFIEELKNDKVLHLNHLNTKELVA